MKMFREMLREIKPRGWFLIAMIGMGNTALVIAGWSEESAIPLVFLAVAGFALAILVQLNHSLIDSSLELSQEVIEDRHKDADLTTEMIENYLQAISDLSFHDRGRTAVHYSRLRKALVKRHPEMEGRMEKVDLHPDLLRRYL